MEFYNADVSNTKAKSNDGVNVSAAKFDDDDEYEVINIINIKF